MVTPYHNNNPNSPGYYPTFGGAFSGFGGSIGNPFSMGGGDWVRSFGKMSLNMQFWNWVGSLAHGEGLKTSNGGLFYWNPYAGKELRRWQTGNTTHIQYSGRWISLSGLDRYGDAANSGGPNYAEQSFSQSGFQGSWTNAEGVGAAGGFFYSVGGRVFNDGKGNWYVYASASAWAPAAEKKATSIVYFSTVSVLKNGKPIQSRNLQVWNSDITRVGQENFSYIGDGYMSLPDISTGVSIEISITYNMYQFWNGHAFPRTPYVYKINF